VLGTYADSIVGRLDYRLFTSSDIELLAVVAERLAGATQTRLDRSAVLCALMRL
jgi:hypothetical protein